VEGLQPLSELARVELRPIIRTDLRREPATQKPIGQDHQDVLRADPSGHHRRRTSSAVLIEDIQDPKGPTVLCPIGHEVIRPDVMAIRRPQPEARPPKSGSLGRLRGHGEAFLPPDRLHAIVPHVPALESQQIRPRSVAIPPVLLRVRKDSLAQPLSKRI
jgi:hypothetical protein